MDEVRPRDGLDIDRQFKSFVAENHPPTKSIDPYRQFRRPCIQVPISVRLHDRLTAAWRPLTSPHTMLFEASRLHIKTFKPPVLIISQLKVHSLLQPLRPVSWWRTALSPQSKVGLHHPWSPNPQKDPICRNRFYGQPSWPRKRKRLPSLALDP